MVELALSLPVLLLLLLGMIEFGHGFNSYLTVLASSRDAARFAAQGGAGDTAMRNLIANEVSRLPIPDLNAWKASECTATDGGICIDGIDSAGAWDTVFAVGGVPAVKVEVCHRHELIVGIPWFLGNSGALRMCTQTTMRLAAEAN